jgi:AraC family transcriptional activator of tynA and feaB
LKAGEVALVRIDRLSTDDVPAASRFDFWRGIFAERDQSMALEGDPGAFHGNLTRFTAGELKITSVKSSPLVTRSGASADHGETNFSLQLVHSGQCLLRHAGAETVAETGDMFIIDPRRSYELAFRNPVQGLVLTLPRMRFGGHAEALEALAGRRMNLNGGSAAVLSGFVRSAWDQLVERDGEEWPESASAVIWELLTAALQGDRAGAFGGSRADDLRRRAIALIDSRLLDPEFRSSSIAGELGVSARYLQQVFAEVGTTPSRFLLARRLDAAAARLRHPDKRCRITDVALEGGFSDLSYFSRAFRRRFGVAAHSYRSSLGATTAGWDSGAPSA